MLGLFLCTEEDLHLVTLGELTYDERQCCPAVSMLTYPSLPLKSLPHRIISC